MTHQMNTKVRLVRCPKCRLVLPELPEISVYKCGGCNTVLQAKYRKPDMKEVGFDYHETNENGVKKADHVSISHVEESSTRSTTQINLKQSQDVVSPGQDCFEYEDSSPGKKEEMEQNKDNSISSPDTGQCGNVVSDGNSEWHRGRRVSDFSTSMELTSNEMEDSSLELKPYLVTEKARYESNGKREYFSNEVPIGLNKQRGKSMDLSHQDRVGSKIAYHEPEIQSVKRDAEELLKVWTYKGLRVDESDSTDDNQSPWDDNILADKVSPDAQYVELPRKLVSHDFKHASSADSLSNLPIAEPRFGFSGPTWTSRPPRRKLKHPDMPPKQSESLKSKIEMHHQGVYGLFSHESRFLEANRNTMKYAHYNLENFPETSRYGHYSACRTRVQNQEYVPRLPRDLQAGQKNNSGFCSPDTPLYSGPDKLKLLKKINELKDEIKRTRISDLRFPSRFSSDQTGFHHDAAPLEEVCSDFFRCSCRTKCSQAIHMPHRGTCVCLHCSPEGFRYSGGLQLHNKYCNDETFYKDCYSPSSSHQLYAGQQFLHDHETKYDNRMHRETEGVRRVKERDSLSKHYMRPTAGGIPIISCYHCSELLQLPADFILVGRRSHRLKCNACRKVMTFSIQGGKHLVPCIPDAIAPPPSMVDDDCSDSFDRIEMASSSSYVRCKNSVDTRKGKNKELSPTSRAAALHRLMGYSSPSQVIRRRAIE